MWDEGYSYYLKHRAPGQVGEDGKPVSTTLGAVNIQGDWDAFSFRVSGGDKSVEFKPFLDTWGGDVDIDWGVKAEKSLWAVWTYSRRAVIYSDYEQTQQVGWLDVTGTGTYYLEKEVEIITDTDEDGNYKGTRYEEHWTSHATTHGFVYKFNVFNCPMLITYDREGGFFKKTKLTYTASNAFAPGVPLFRVEGDGENNCTIETFANSDPVSTILAGYAISCKLDPTDFSAAAKKQCDKHIKLKMPAGFSNFIGMNEQQFVQRFAYVAPVPPVFAEAVASYTPPEAVPLAFAVAEDAVSETASAAASAA